MDELQRIQQELQQGRIDPERLIALLITLQHKLQQAHQQLHDAQQRIQELEKQQGSSTNQPEQPFSMRAEEQRQQARGKHKRKRKPKGRRGRVTTQDKLKQATRIEHVYPEGIQPSRCQPSHQRPVWRLENGQAVLIAYQIYRGPNNHYGQIPGVLGRSEFGMEILVEIAYLVYQVGLSFDKVTDLLHFFQNLTLKKSQVDALLHRLARHWEKEFDHLCTLLAHSLVVHADETSWSVNSVWAFVSEKARLLLFGVHKDGDTLKQILDPETFAGILISDDAAVYAHFSSAQKCWAHLLRKAIKLTLQEPDNDDYRDFTDRLLDIYRQATRVQKDGRLGDAGRQRKVVQLEETLIDLCAQTWLAEWPRWQGPADDYRRLVNELMRLVLAGELFTFVTAKPVPQADGESQAVPGTNNTAERALREPALARKTGRTNKTVPGARRQTILSSVLGSLRLYLSCFTLHGVMAEIATWLSEGQSRFAQLVERVDRSGPPSSVLDTLLPLPDG